jgi:esterase/lipase
METKSLTKCFLVGVSFGGILVQEIAAHIQTKKSDNY